jgi:hypothetical protein
VDAVVLGSRELHVTDTINAKVGTGSHVLRVSDARKALERKLDTLIDCVGNVKK